MKITRKHFIRSPFLAVSKNYVPSLADCFFLVLYKLSFKDGLFALKNIFKQFLDYEVRELPRVFVSIIIITLVLIFYPLSVFVMFIIMYCKYRTKAGIKKQKDEFKQYTEFQIKIKTLQAGWNEL